MRIAYLVSRYPAVNHTFILREIVTLRALGFDIQTIAIRGADRPLEQMTALECEEAARTLTVLPAGAPLFAAQWKTLLQRPGAYFAGLLLALRLAGADPKTALFHVFYFLEAVTAGRMAVDRGYSHLHTHFSSTVALIAARVFGLGLSVTIHGPDEFRETGFRMRQKVAASRFISTISHYARSQIMQASSPADWPKIEINRLGVDPEIFQPGPPRTENPGLFHLICVGRLAGVKAQRILLGACARLLAEGSKLCLHLVGSGPDRQALEDFTAALGIKEHVIFEGPRNQEEVIALYRQADIFALASFAEGVPVVLMEAMAMELPCVATWVNGVPELISQNSEGLLVAPSDFEGLAEALRLLMQDPALRIRLGRAGRQRVLEEYNLRRNVEGLAEVFRQRLSDHA